MSWFPPALFSGWRSQERRNKWKNKPAQHQHFSHGREPPCGAQGRRKTRQLQLRQVAAQNHRDLFCLFWILPKPGSSSKAFRHQSFPRCLFLPCFLVNVKSQEVKKINESEVKKIIQSVALITLLHCYVVRWRVAKAGRASHSKLAPVEMTGKWQGRLQEDYITCGLFWAVTLDCHAFIFTKQKAAVAIIKAFPLFLLQQANPKLCSFHGVWRLLKGNMILNVFHDANVSCRYTHPLWMLAGVKVFHKTK